ncbi:MAG: preprotein translocase subunit SecY [Demequinaceae bacterium]|nr:preprotein translocase subunit SecY [Demequinaceae bacterium]
MLGGFVNALRTPDLRRKIFFTLGILALYRFGCAIPTPGVDYGNLEECLASGDQSGFFQIINLFTGGALTRLSVFALGVMPYITASIMIQLLRTLVPRFQELHSQGAEGQAKLTQYTRYVTIGFSALQAASYITLARNGGLYGGPCPNPVIPDTSWSRILIMILTMTAGTVLIMWLGERITERGLGNGMSLLIFVSIASGLPSTGYIVAKSDSSYAWFWVLLTIVGVLATVVYVEQSQRRIPVQYAKRMVGRKMLGGSSTYIPIRINMAGVIPIIFAASLLSLPQLIVQFAGDNAAAWVRWVNIHVAQTGEPLNNLFYVLLILFFCYFYTSITFNPDEVAENMKKYGGFIPGIRPGKPTAEYLDYVLSRITFAGSLYLATVALAPVLVFKWLGLGTQVGLGGSSLIIIVGVGLDTVRRIQSQLERRHYEGFLK